MKIREEAAAIFNKFSIQAVEVEPTVYRVINNTQEFNIDTLESELKERILLISDKTRYEKDEEGYNTMYAKVYYILLDYDDNNDLMLKYNNILSQEKETMIKSFRYNPNYTQGIDTVYSKVELKPIEA